MNRGILEHRSLIHLRFKTLLSIREFWVLTVDSKVCGQRNFSKKARVRVSDPDSMRSVDPDSDSESEYGIRTQEGKNDP